MRTQCARSPFSSPGLHVGERREVTRAGIHAAESSAAFPGAGPKEPLGGPTTAVPRLHRLDCGFHAARQTGGLRSSRSVGEAGFPRGSDSSPTARHRDLTAPGALWPGSTSPFTRPHLSKHSPASLQPGRRTSNVQAYLTRTRNGRSRTLTVSTTWPGAHWLHTHWVHASELPRAYRRQRGSAEARRLPIGCQNSRVVSRSLAGPMGISAVERTVSLEWWLSCFLW